MATEEKPQSKRYDAFRGLLMQQGFSDAQRALIDDALQESGLAIVEASGPLG